MHDTFGSSPKCGAGLPTARRTRADRRLGGVVDHEAESGHLTRHDQAPPAARAADEQVVGETGRLDAASPRRTSGRRSQSGSGSSWTWWRIPTSHSPPVRRAARRAFRRPRIGQIDPADHAADERDGRRGREELARLVEARDRLDQDRAVDAGGGQLRGEVIRAEPSVDGGQVGRQPRVVGAAGSSR